MTIIQKGELMGDLISRQAAIDTLLFGKEMLSRALDDMDVDNTEREKFSWGHGLIESNIYDIEELPSAQQWIPCSERLPENTEPVNITWANRNPEPYYADIKNKTFTATGHYHNGKWFWYSAVCQDYLDEYGKCEMDEMDRDIEVIAWMPLPEPYKGEEG